MDNNFPRLFFSNTRMDKNLKYLLGCDVGDDIAAMKQGTKLSILAPALEISRLKSESGGAEIVPIESLSVGKKLSRSDLISAFIRHVTKKKTLIVGENFPFKLASDLLANGFKIRTDSGDILPERLVKSEHEVECIGKVLRVVGECFERTREILRQSKIGKNGVLNFRGRELTSEFVREDIETLCYASGCLAGGTIVSCGHQSAEPHCQGYGPIYANQFIVMDLFPFHRVSGYYADITRTFLRGTPSEAQANMYEAVKVAQERACAKLKAGVRCSELVSNTLKFFKSKGYETDCAAEIPRGMFHSLGHGFGLEIHEEPRISTNATRLKKGNVITLEPGLYYPEIGGVRIEDDFLIGNENSLKLSTDIPCDWIV